MTGEPDHDGDIEDITLQPRCARCDTEIPGPAVIGFSRGEGGCPSCGRTATVYPVSRRAAYSSELRATRDIQYAKYLAGKRRPEL